MKPLFLVFLYCLSISGWSQQAPLKSLKVEYRPVPLIRTLYGKIEAKYRATISAQTSGRVVAMNVDIGDYVKKNTILIKLRSTSQQARFDAASARYKKAAADYTRARTLYKKRLFSKAMLDKAAADYKSALSALNQAKEELERTIIRAPYHGIVVKRHIEAGETARIGQALLTGLSLETLDIVTEVPQEIMLAFRKNKTATVKLGKKTLTLGKISISPYADPDTHTFTVKARLPKGDFGIYPGMFVKLRITTGQSQRLLVPVTAVVHRSEVSAVYTIDKNNQIVMRQVRTGRLYSSGDIEILSGLMPGDRVALNPERATLLLKQAK